MILALHTHPVEGATLGSLVSRDPACSLALSTIELPWDNDIADHSCVPAGDYELLPYLSPEHGLVYRLHCPALKVYGEGFVPEGCRFGAELHPLNFARESRGCIGPGLSAMPMLDPVAHVVVPAVQDSQRAMARLRSVLGSNRHQLTIAREGLTDA